MPGFELYKVFETELSGLDRVMIQSELQEASESTDIDFDRRNLTGTSKTWGICFSHEWEIEKSEDGRTYTLIERRSVDDPWNQVFLLAVFGIGIVLSLLAATQVFTGFLVGAAAISGLTCICLLLSVLYYAIALSESLVPEIRGVTEEVRTYAYHLLPGFFSAVVLGFGVAGWAVDLVAVTGAASISSFVLFGVLVSKPGKVENLTEYLYEVFDAEDGMRLADSFAVYLGGGSDPRMTVIPGLAAVYFFQAVNLVLPGLSLIFAYTWFGFLGLVFTGFFAIPYLYVQIRLFSVHVSEDMVLDAFYDVRQNNRGKLGKKTQVVWFVLTLAASLSLVGTGLWVLSIFGDPLLQAGMEAVQGPVPGTHRFAVTGVVVLASVSLLLYPVLGLVYQTLGSAKNYIGYILDSSPIEKDFSTSATVLQIEGGRQSPFCLSTWFSDYIFIPSQFFEDSRIGPEELEAIIAHEEKHIRENEALLLTLMPFVSVLFFTGQNVVYGLLDFREREFQADDYARQKVGEDAIVSALEKMESVVNAEENGEGPGWWQSYFGLFYGTFAQSKAHPSVEERKERLRDSS